MAGKRKPSSDSAVNTEGWMISYADMATILLAMFIVLTTLGKDQTGVSLYNGTGSFRHALNCFGLPGLFGRSPNLIQAKAPNARFQVDRPGGEPGRDNKGPDQKGQPGRVIDGEEEHLQRFLGELDRQFAVTRLAPITGHAVVDFHDRLNKQAPYLTRKQQEVIGQVVPLLLRKEYRVVLVVWATTPAASAWVRAANQAREVAGEMSRTWGLDALARSRLLPLGQPWRYVNFRRPIMSLVISKTRPPG